MCPPEWPHPSSCPEEVLLTGFNPLFLLFLLFLPLVNKTIVPFICKPHASGTAIGHRPQATAKNVLGMKREKQASCSYALFSSEIPLSATRLISVPRACVHVRYIYLRSTLGMYCRWANQFIYIQELFASTHTVSPAW